MEASWRAIYWAREIRVCSASVGPLLESAWAGGRGLELVSPSRQRNVAVLGLGEALLPALGCPGHPLLQQGGSGEGWSLQRWCPCLSLSPTQWLACKGCYLLTTD